MQQKKLSEMTKEEIALIPDYDWKHWNPFDKKSCDTCIHITEAVSLWCSNPQAIASRGTRLPGICSCPYWAPDWAHLPRKYDTKYYREYWKSIKPVVQQPAKASSEVTHTKEDNISKNKNKWLRIKEFVRGNKNKD